MRRKKWIGFWKYAVMTVVAVVVGFPYFWLLTTSLKESYKIFLFPPQWLPSPVRWQNYADLFSKTNYALYLWNSVKVAALTTLGTVRPSLRPSLNFPGATSFLSCFCAP